MSGTTKKNGPVRGKDARLLKIREMSLLLHQTIRQYTGQELGRERADKLTAKNQEYWVPLMYPSTFADEGPTVQLCGDSNLAKK